MLFAVTSSFDVAFWFADQALNENEYLQPQKMHRLLYLSQAYYAIAYDGNKLMPSVFVADEMGPLEPTLYQAFSTGRPQVEVELFLPTEVEMYLTSIWRRFGHLSMDRLNKLTCDNNAYAVALRKGKRAEIPLESMIAAFTSVDKKDPVQKVTPGDKILVTQDGTPVKAQTWTPGAKPPGPKG